MKKIVFCLILSFFITGFLSLKAQATQEIKETLILSGYLGDIFDFNKRILKYSHNMQDVAKPFGNPRHRARYRFEPKTDNARQVMILSRKISARFKIINGMLYHSGLPNRVLTTRQALETTEDMVVYSKRALRAIKDNNYALYLASAQGIEAAVFEVNKLLAGIERAINAQIEESDSLKESL
jgi:hypothetical protein